MLREGETRALIGYTGFVGSNLQAQYQFTHFYNSSNLDQARGQHFNELFFAGLPAQKWLINQNPERDWANIESICQVLDTVTTDRMVLISTVDVYPTPDAKADESLQPDLNGHHAYGTHRYRFEEYISSRYGKSNPSNCHIVRLPALFGKGLKKNVIYDLLNNNCIDKINPEASFQWYCLDWLRRDLDWVISQDIKIANFATEPVPTSAITSIFSYSKSSFKGTAKPVYDFRTSHKDGGYLASQRGVVEAIQQYVKSARLQLSHLAVSNICINQISNEQFARILRLYGLKHVEVAPTKLDTWDRLSRSSFQPFVTAGLEVSSFQSVTFGLDSNIFDPATANSLRDHLVRVVKLAGSVGAKRIVFGCPRNRKVLDGDQSNSRDKAVTFFRQLDVTCQENGVVLCIEPNAKQYGCNFVNNLQEASDLVNQIDCEAVKTMTDLGNLVMEGDDMAWITESRDLIRHVQVSQPNLDDFRQPHPNNRSFRDALRANGYDGMVSLEMLIRDPTREIDILRESLDQFIKSWGRGHAAPLEPPATT